MSVYFFKKLVHCINYTMVGIKNNQELLNTQGITWISAGSLEDIDV